MKWTDEQVETLLSRVLRGGVVSSSVVVFTGLLVVLAQGQGTRHFDHFHPSPVAPPGLTGAFVIWAGLGILIGTPVTRVVLSIVAFGMQKDRLYVGITLIVLVVLAYSLVYAQ